MPDQTEPAEPAREPVRLFNRSTDKKILTWGRGVIMPGESFLTDTPEAYAADQPGSDWVTDAEATRLLEAGHPEADELAISPEPPQVVQDAVQAAQDHLNAVEAEADAAIAEAQHALDAAEVHPAQAQPTQPAQPSDKPAEQAADTGGTA